MATLRQVAELAGVSIGTASVALNSGQVKESTRKRHVDAIEREHGFVAGLIEVGIQKLTKRYGDFTIPSGIAAMKEILKELRPTPFFAPTITWPLAQ